MLPKLLNKFNAVSLKEETGVALCKEGDRADAALVCDPTILLLGSEYVFSILKKEIVETDTVFTYLLNWETDFPLEEIKTLIQKENLEMNFVGAHGIENRNLFPFIDDLTISSWLQKMASSKYSFTNSYHGTVLSILLKKSFVTFPLSGVSAKMNGRITTLLSKVGLESRIYSPAKTIQEIVDQPIDWDLIEEKLNAFRAQSALFLEQALREN
jgi:exopolysaccharide biosynthesis predicted pyruvyltransferase EpsI